MEGEAGRDTERAARGSSVLGPERPRRVLDQHDLLRYRRLQRFPLDRAAEEVNGHHRARSRRHGGCDGCGVDEERVRIDVDEHRSRSAQLDDVGGCGKRVRGNDHFVARADLQGKQREMERCGSGRDDGGMRRAHGLRQRGLELADLRSHRQLTAFDHLPDGRELSLADIRPRQPDRLGHGVETPSFSRYQAIVRSSPSSRST